MPLARLLVVPWQVDISSLAHVSPSLCLHLHMTLFMCDDIVSGSKFPPFRRLKFQHTLWREGESPSNSSH
jgi:hypothetical protein